MSKQDDSLFDEEFGDLLEDMEEKDPEQDAVKAVEVAEQPKQKPAQKPQGTLNPQKQAPKQAPKADTPTDGFNPDEGETVTLGTKVSSIPIPRFKASKEGKARISLLSEKVLAMKTHYVEGLGNFICMNDKCCELEGLPRVRYIIPIVQYETNSKGGVISDTMEVKALSLGDDAYTALADAIEFSGRSAKDVDIIVTCSDEQYQKLTFSADASKGATWRTFPEDKKKAMVAYFKANKDKLGLGIAKRVSMEVYLQKKGFVTAGGPSLAPTDNIEDLLDE